MLETQLYNSCGDALCLDLVNSIGRTPAGTRNERLVDYPALLLWSEQAGSITRAQSRALTDQAEERKRAARAVLTRVRALREAVFETFLAEAQGRRPPDEPLRALNDEIARAMGHAQVAPDSKGYAWTWSGSAEALDAPLWPIARSAAELLVSPDLELVRECASDTCLRLFVDRTRNHGRRWCEMKGCGNRAKVREHRRQRSAARKAKRA